MKKIEIGNEVRGLKFDIRVPLRVSDVVHE